jgi:predicted nucleic acid-binding protein
MTVVVSDTSAVRALHWLGLLDILQKLYAQVLVPPAVVRELAQASRSEVRVEIAHFPFIQVRAPSDAMRVQQLMSTLDAGESEAIALAEELSATLVIDDSQARKVAIQGGLQNGRHTAAVAACEGGRLCLGCQTAAHKTDRRTRFLRQQTSHS